MNNSLVIEFFARVLFSFTRGVTEHYDPDEPEVEIFGYDDSLSSEGREWNCQPVDKPIYQEYSQPSDEDYNLLSVGNSRVRYRVISAHQRKMKTNSKMKMTKWLGSDSDHPFFAQFVNQCTLAHLFHF